MIILKKWKVYLIAIVSTLLVGGLAGFLSMNSMGIYSFINTPPLAPPSWLFPVVWTILYILMGISVAIYFTKTNKVPTIYILQLLVNFIWPLIFFNLQAYFLSFIVILLLIALVILMINEFSKVSKLAAFLQIPYLLWLLFASYLNLAIYLLN